MTEIYYGVTSKWNQPRSVVAGTTPYQGVDLGEALGTKLYPVYPGWIVYQSGYDRDTSNYLRDQYGRVEWEIVLELDFNGDGVQNDSKYVKYDHVSRVGYFATGAKVEPRQMIAKSGNENGAYGAHLHFGILRTWLCINDTGNNRTWNTGEWVSNERHCVGVMQWNYGDDLDFISYLKYYDLDNTVYVTVYRMDGDRDPVRGSMNPGDVVLYHRTAGTSRWSSAGMSSVGGDRWYIDLDSLGYPPGTSIHWMIGAKRAEISTTPRTAYFPPKYETPPDDPNSVTWPFPYYTATTR